MWQSPGVEEQARRLLELLPAFQQWAVTRVQRAGADHNLSLRQFAALHVIRQGASSPGQIARHWQVTPAVVTGIVDRLERRGLVRRAFDPDDRRRLRLILTDAGLAASLELEQTLARELAEQLVTAPPDELAALDRATDLLRRTLSTLQLQQEPELAVADREGAPDHPGGRDRTEASRPGQGEPSGTESLPTTPTAQSGRQ